MLLNPRRIWKSRQMPEAQSSQICSNPTVGCAIGIELFKSNQSLLCVCVCSCDYAMYRAFYEIDNTLQYIMYVKYIPSLFNVFTLHPVASFRVNRVVSIIWWVDCRRRTMLSSHNTLEMLLCELDSHTHIVHKNTFVRHCHPMKSIQNWFDDGKER